VRAFAVPTILALAASCTGAAAQQNSSVQAEPGEIWHCFAHRAYYKENDAGLYPKTPVVTGTLVFHAVTPDEQWSSAARVEFTSLSADPDVRHGTGIAAVVPQQDPDRIYVLAIIDGAGQPLGTFPYGTRVPYEIAFDDATGTVTIKSGKYRITGKPDKLLRSSMHMKCVGSDVSFAV
jgi:ABC-type transport system substrate-binding protein